MLRNCIYSQYPASAEVEFLTAKVSIFHDYEYPLTLHRKHGNIFRVVETVSSEST